LLAIALPGGGCCQFCGGQPERAGIQGKLQSFLAAASCLLDGGAEAGICMPTAVVLPLLLQTVDCAALCDRCPAFVLYHLAIISHCCTATGSGEHANLGYALLLPANTVAIIATAVQDLDAAIKRGRAAKLEIFTIAQQSSIRAGSCICCAAVPPSLCRLRSISGASTVGGSAGVCAPSPCLPCSRRHGRQWRHG